MSSKPQTPLKPRTIPPRFQATPRTSQSSPISPSDRELVRKPRSLIYAVGVAAIVITGSIFGAQLKTSKQATDERRLIASENTNDGSTSLLQESASPTKHATTSYSKVVDDAETLQHIKLLEDRKATLSRQKNGFEMKLQALHERKLKRDAQMQAEATK